jgi:hypothetical protein
LANKSSTSDQYKPNNGYKPTRIFRPTARSRITNGREILPGLDHRSERARRFRDLQAQLVMDLGGDEVLSAAKRAIIRRCAVIQVELELRELKFAETETPYQHLEQYSRISSNLRRMLESLGLERVAKDVTPNLATYLRSGKRDDNVIDEAAE